MEQQNERKKMANIFYFDFADADLNNGYYCFANLFFFFFFAKAYLYFIRNIPVEISLFELVRIIKGASLGGIIVGISCWYISFKKY